MSAEQKGSTRTLAIMFDYWVRHGNQEKAREFMTQIAAKKDDYSIVALAICIGKARDNGAQELTLLGMTTVLERISSTEDSAVPEGVNVSSLIRCSIQLLLKEMTHGDEEAARKQCQDSCSMMGNILDQGLKIFRNLGTLEGSMTNDIIWIISKAYNSALHVSQEDNIEGSLALADLALKVSFKDFLTSGIYTNDDSGWTLFLRMPSTRNLPKSRNGKCTVQRS